ncbi:MAG: S-layer homology domain-containing protein [Anaerotignum sp.]
MKKFLSVFLTMALCASLVTPAFAAGGQYEQVRIGDITFEAAYKETTTLKFQDPYDFDDAVPKAQTVTVCVVKPGSRITITDSKGNSDFARQVGLYTYDSKKGVYWNSMAAEIYSGTAEQSFSIYTVPVLLQIGNCFAKLGNDTTPTKPSEPVVGSFTDVKANAYYAEPVKWAVENKVTSGTSNTTFSPDATCTNAQILTFIWRACGSPEATIANPFTNLSGNEYYAKAALWAYEKGMISGTSFDADKPCTRSMTAEYLWKQAGSPSMSITTDTFSDVTSGTSYAQAVAWAVENGVTSGTSNATFSPNDTCTRGQIVTFLYRALVK